MDFGREHGSREGGGADLSSQARSRRRQATADGRRDSGAEPGHGVTMGVTLQQLYTLSNRITVDVRWRESSGSVTLT